MRFIQNLFSQKSLPNQESRRERRIGETGGKRNVEEGGHQKSSTIKGEFVSNLFLVKKKDGGQRPVINLKQLNACISYCHFKVEGLQNLKYMLQKGGYMCKLDLKDAYFSVPLEKDSKICFDLGPAPRIFTKLVKVPMTILRKIHIKIIIYLDDMLLIGHSLEDIVMSRDTVIFLLQHLRFVINWKKSVLTPVQEIEFLGLTINSVILELSLNKTKIQKVISECQYLLNNPQTSIWS